MTNGHHAQDADIWRAQSYLMGHPLEQREHFGEALVIYQDVIQREPEDILAHLLAGGALLNLERQAEARTYFERALTLAEQARHRDANDRRAYVFYADALWLLDQDDAALAAYDQAVRVAPAHPEAYVNKGWALYVLSRLAEAWDHFEQAHRLRPDDPDILYREGCVHWDMGHYQENLRLLERAIELDATQPRYYRSLATVLSYLGREREARQAMAQYRHMVSTNA